MVWEIVTILLIALAAISNAAMDRLENKVAYNNSVFKNLNQKFWCKEVSWQYAKKIFNYKIDAWHLAKSLMVVCFAFAIYLGLLKQWYDVLIVGIVWNGTFNLFYNKILKQ